MSATLPRPSDLLAGVDPKPALEGGRPVREKFLPVALPWIGEREKAAVAEVLESGWITTGARAIETAGQPLSGAPARAAAPAPGPAAARFDPALMIV